MDHWSVWFQLLLQGPSLLFSLTTTSTSSLLFRASCRKDVKFSGPSARAGFASEQAARGESEVVVQHRGRWSAPSSFAVLSS